MKHKKVESKKLEIDASGIWYKGRHFERGLPPDPTQLAVQFLATCASTRKSIYYSSSNYGFKHLAEKTMGSYISNGAFIEAALACGFKIVPDGINAHFNISISKEVWRQAGYYC